LRWLRGLSDWTELLGPERTTAAQRNRVYRRCMRDMVIDYGADALTVHWQPASARLLGREMDTLNLKGV
jgi:hypothetical protein